ncbi:hypothetical protein TWF718_010379 [Orbilia javanica]|uniref:F-box domain-containing protein n=1 Tax=Orbilia javanica TaxID=47235 RepID=A0AAN8MQR5_9PEZI
MANLLTIGAIPELLDGVLEYLEQGEVYSLLLTCRTVYPTAYRHLWKTIRLYSRTRTHRSVMMMLQHPGFMRPSSSDEMCYKLADILNTLGPQNTGLSLTRKLVFHENSLHFSSGFLRSHLMVRVGALLQRRELDLNCIELNFSISVDSEGQKEAVSWFLTHLREYSKSKSPDEFSIILTAPLDVVVARMIDIEKVSKLTLSIDWENSSGNINRPDQIFIPVEEDTSDAYASDDSDSGSESRRRMSYRDRAQFNTQLTERFTALLLRAVNLVSLTICKSSRSGGSPRYVDLKLSKPLRDLQSAFYTLPKLRELSISDKFFHPSYFIAPPESARTVSYSGYFSSRWLQSFKKCPFTNVKRLSIKILKAFHGEGLWCRTDFEKQPLGDVAVTGLIECEIQDALNLAPDLSQCIIRRNKNLNNASKQQILRGISRKLQQAANRILLPSCSNTLDYIRTMEGDNPLYPKPNDPSFSQQDGMMAAGNQCLKMLPNAVGNFEALKSIKLSAVPFANQCEEKIKSLLERSKTILTMEYTQRYLNGIEEKPGDIDKAAKECLRWMLDNFDSHPSWQAAQPQANLTMWEIRGGINGQVNEFTGKEASEYVLALAESGELESLDIGMISEKFTQDCAQKLSGMEFEKPVLPVELQPGQVHRFDFDLSIPEPRGTLLYDGVGNYYEADYLAG